MRDHGGNLDQAMVRWGGKPEDWVDLSTGINAVPYPLPEISNQAWAALPTGRDIARLVDAAREAYRTSAAVVPVAGAQAAIQMVPFLRSPGVVRILGPTYNEHAANFERAGWSVRMVSKLAELSDAEVAVVVNPNNPDGRVHSPADLRTLAESVALLVVDESFADPVPEVSLAEDIPENALVLRSFGKFFGLAGLRLGFVLGSEGLIDVLSGMSGPWPVSGAAIEIGAKALSDTDWQDQTRARLTGDADWLDTEAQGRGWSVVGGTTLFRLYQTPNAEIAQNELARAKVWSRIFPYSGTWVRLGLPAYDHRKQVSAAK